jgi:hypothetical protein
MGATLRIVRTSKPCPYCKRERRPWVPGAFGPPLVLRRLAKVGNVYSCDGCGLRWAFARRPARGVRGAGVEGGAEENAPER